MNWQHAKRIAWKDMRRMSPFAVAQIAFWILWLGVICWMARNNSDFVAPHSISATFWGMLWTAVLYAGAWGSMTFSLEHDEKTYPFLRSLPVNAKSIFYGKLAFGLLSTLALIGVLGGLAGIYAWLMPNSMRTTFHYDPSPAAFAITSGLIPVMMMIGVFWSLRVRRPLVSFLATVATPYALGLVAASLMFVVWELDILDVPDRNSDETNNLVLGWVLAALGITFFALARRTVVNWLHSEETPNRMVNPFTVSMPISIGKTASRSKTSGFWRLLWLQRKQSWLSLLSLVVAFVWGILLLCIYLAMPKPASPRSTLGFEDPGFAFAALWIGGILGVLAFRSEHRDRRYRLLGQLGVGEFSYWLSQLLLPMIATIALAVIASLPMIDEFPAALPHLTLTLTLTSLTLFSIGQFCSLAWRSPIFAGGAILMTSIFVIMWIGLCLALDVAWWLVFLPMIGLPLLATYLRVPRWFRETGSWRQWVLPLAPIALLIFGLPIATAAFRAYQIPQVEIPAEWTTDRIATPEETASAARYQAVFDSLPTLEDLEKDNDDYSTLWDLIGVSQYATLSDWVVTNDRPVKELLTAVETGCSIYDKFQPTQRNRPYRKTPPKHRQAFVAAAVLLIKAQQAEDDGDIDEAWSYYVAALSLAEQLNDGYAGARSIIHQFRIESAAYRGLTHWALLEENTAKKIESAIEHLEDFRSNQPPLTHQLAAEYRQSRKDLEDWSAHLDEWGSDSPISLRSHAHYFPWEAARTRRLNDLQFVLTRDSLEDTEADRAILELHDRPENPESHEYWKYAVTSFGWVYPEHLGAFYQLNSQRRGAILQLAAIAEYLRDGKLPQILPRFKIGKRDLPDGVLAPSESFMVVKAVTDEHGRLHRVSFVWPDIENYRRENYQRRLFDSLYPGRDDEDDEVIEDGDGGFGVSFFLNSIPPVNQNPVEE